MKASGVKKGFGSVFMVMLLSSMILVSLVLAEAACTHAAESAARNYCLLTGRSLLAEYKQELFERYGLFMVRGYEDELSALARFYLTADTELSDCVIDMHCLGADADASRYCGLDTELFLKQAEKLGMELSAKNALTSDRFSAILAGFKKGLDTKLSIDGIEKSLEAVPKPDVQEPQTGQSAYKEAKKLRAKLKAAKQDPNIKTISRESIPAAEKNGLPSVVLGYRSRKTLLFSGGIFELGTGSFFFDEYALDVCSNAVDQAEDTVLKLEAEYLLFGSLSDAQNQKYMKTALYSVRFPLNLMVVLKEPAMVSTVTTLAALFPFLPPGITIAALSVIWAGIETKNDIVLLFDGKTVPLIKTAAQFATSLQSYMQNGRYNAKAAPAVPKGTFGTYKDYLRILLLAVPENEKAARLMDLIQTNLRLKCKTEFSFRDFAYGFDLEALFSRRHFASNPFLSSAGGAYVRQTHVYR